MNAKIGNKVVSDDQRNRFIETAKALGADKDDGTLDRVLGQVAPPVVPKGEKRAEE